MILLTNHTRREANVTKAPWLRTEAVLDCHKQSALFFPPDYTATFAADIRKARDLCQGCPIFDACLNWAVPQTGLEGIWAATTPADRRRIRKQQKVAA
jgi:WhiB family redox-sensing transcriptional regulator